MSDESNIREELQELEMLLPFHATGRLTPSEVVRIEQYVSDHPERMQIVSEEKDAVVAANEAVVVRRGHGFAAVAARIAATRDESSGRGSGILRALWRFFELPSARSVRWASAAVAVLVILQGAAIATLVVSRHSNQFATASGESSSREPGTLATIRFADGATAPAIAALLAGLDMRIVDGPAGGGLFTIRIGPKDMSDTDRDRVIAVLKARSDLVLFVTRLQ